MMRAPDDGAGNGTTAGTDATGANIGAAGTGEADTTGVAQRDAARTAALGATRDDTFDGLRDRLRAVEDEVTDLLTRPVPKSGGTFDNGGNVDRLDRLEAVLSSVFGREFANYDGEKLARANR